MEPYTSHLGSDGWVDGEKLASSRKNQATNLARPKQTLGGGPSLHMYLHGHVSSAYRMLHPKIHRGWRYCTDPFSGRGTTAVEAMAQNRIGIGNDWNELAYVLTKGKIANPKLEDALARLSELEENYDRKDWLRCKGIPNKIKTPIPEVQKHLMYLKQN